MPFTAFDEMGTVGFFTLRNPAESLDELRLGFVIVSPDKWGKGYGKGMIRLGLKFVFEIYGAKRASLGVFENNFSAYYCYKSLGFCDAVLDITEKYCVLGEEWNFFVPIPSLISPIHVDFEITYCIFTEVSSLEIVLQNY